ncbi:heme biosynthesis protein HemY [Pseudomonas sp. LTJR-52]|uniref:heme biosynthesis protein HemY n=1 Tax=Pseudomonas sp. LTJR-52 TaxID=2479392 RepID=UPI000EFB89BA|nr:heme biosynthesis HemY N-terminal domain-containing protein [Pseudomonas sp. LTJR-52]AYN92651.1 heme biosynthesis protein HemY [Pseudomonas sp. LTJR-52]
MKRLTLLFLFAVLVALGVAVIMADEPGYVLFSYNSFRYESSFWAFLALIVAAVIVLYLLRLALSALGVSGRVVNPWSRYNKQRRVAQAAHRGQLELAEGDWSSALKHLKTAAESDAHPLTHYLGAARAANEMGQYEESDALLQKAREREPHADVAIGLTQAQLQIHRAQYSEALTSLAPLHAKYPKHPYVLSLMQRLYVTTRDWPALIGLLPELRKQRVLGESELSDLERRAWLASLDEVTPIGDESPIQAITRQWQQVPSALKSDVEIAHAYAARLHELNREDDAEDVLRAAIKRNYDDRLVRLYGYIKSRDPAKQLQLAEGWLRNRPNDPVLLLTLGRLCQTNQLWGKARDYLEASLSAQRTPEACGELARLLAHLGETDRSNQLLLESTGSRPTPPALRA